MRFAVHRVPVMSPKFWLEVVGEDQPGFVAELEPSRQAEKIVSPRVEGLVSD